MTNMNRTEGWSAVCRIHMEYNYELKGCGFAVREKYWGNCHANSEFR